MYPGRRQTDRESRFSATDSTESPCLRPRGRTARQSHLAPGQGKNKRFGCYYLTSAIYSTIETTKPYDLMLVSFGNESISIFKKVFPEA